MLCMQKTEKRRPTYDIEAIKAAFDRPENLRVTTTAMRSARNLGFSSAGIVSVIQGIVRRHFYKSMPSHGDHRVWQDVYHVPCEDMVLYVKFTADHISEFLLLSFKEK